MKQERQFRNAIPFLNRASNMQNKELKSRSQEEQLEELRQYAARLQARTECPHMRAIEAPVANGLGFRQLAR